MEVGRKEIKPISDTRFQRGVSREPQFDFLVHLPVLVNYQCKDYLLYIVSL